MLKINVGTVFLHEYDYEINAEKYKINPNWDIRFLDYIVSFSANRKMGFIADAKMAEDIYKNQRKFPIYAWFSTDGNKIYIEKMTINLFKYGEIEFLSRDKIIEDLLFVLIKYRAFKKLTSTIGKTKKIYMR